MLGLSLPSCQKVLSRETAMRSPTSADTVASSSRLVSARVRDAGVVVWTGADDAVVVPPLVVLAVPDDDELTAGR